MPRLLTTLAMILSALLAAGCEQGHTVVVQLQTDLVPGLEFDEVFVQATGARSRRADLRDDYGRPVELTELRSVPTGTDLSVEVELRRGGAPVVSRRVQRRIASDVILAVVVTRNCIEIACPAPGAPSATECRDGVCVPPDCEERGSCVPAECARDSECTSTTDCVMPRCVLGVCLETPDDARCRADEVCSPRDGCVAAAVPDAGSPDAAVAPDAYAPAELDAWAPPPDAWTPPPMTVHRLRTGASSWEVVAVSGTLPTERVQSVFAPSGTGELVVVTAENLHVFHIATGIFADRVARDSVFPELDGEHLDTAYTVDTTLTFATRSDVWIYEWTHGSRTARLDRHLLHEELGDDWRGPLTPPWWQPYASFLVPDNAAGWARPDAARSPCGAASIAAYAGFLSWDGFGPAAMIQTIYDGSCFQFVSRSVYGDATYFTPFSLPGAPASPFQIDAAEWQDGLWVFTSP